MKYKYPIYLPGIIIIILFLVLSIRVYQDYGVSWDEVTQREIGMVSYNYVFNGDNYLTTYIEKDHGVGFELPLVMIEKAFKIETKRDIYLMRHLVTHFFFLIGAFCGYVLILKIFKKQGLAILGLLMLLLQPRLYAHSYFNSKDIPFLSAYIIALLLAFVAFSNRRLFWYFVLGAVCGYAVSIRITGILLTVFLVGFLCVDIIHATLIKDSPLKKVGALLLYLLGFSVFLYICWPTLWPSPITNFIEAYNSLAHFRWEGYVLLNGEMIQGKNLSWNYLPIWFCITMPVLFLLLGFAGFIWICVKAVLDPIKYITNTPERNFILYLVSFIIPFVSIILLHSVVYDDWRHIYFVYPSFVMLVLFVIYHIKNARFRYILYSLCSVQLILVVAFMIKNHPFQQVYFNNLVSHDDEYLRKKFDFEYWGTSYKEGLEYILAHDPSPLIKVHNISTPLKENLEFLALPERNRITYTDRMDDADYFLTGFRWHPEDYEYKPYHSIKVLNSTVVRIYKIKD